MPISSTDYNTYTIRIVLKSYLYRTQKSGIASFNLLFAYFILSYFIEYLDEDISDAVGEKYLKQDMLALDYADAKDMGARIKGVELYKRERNEPDELVRLPVQDVLGEFED